MGIVPALQPLEDGHPRLGLALKLAPIQYLALKRGEEALGHGVVVRIAGRTGPPSCLSTGRSAKLARQIFWRATGPDQRDQLLAKLRWVRLPGFRHRGLLLPQGFGVHGSGLGPVRWNVTTRRSAVARQRLMLRTGEKAAASFFSHSARNISMGLSQLRPCEARMAGCMNDGAD